MDQSSNRTTSDATRTSGRRDMMFCHVCNDEWYRDEHGLECPECGSDFTEIIEDENDPRDNLIIGDDDGGDDDEMPDLAEVPGLARTRHSTGLAEDPEEDDISNVRFTQTAPGRYNVQATITRSVSPQQFRAAGGMAPNSIGGFMSMITGLTGAAMRAQGQQPPQGQGAGLFSGPNQNQDQNREPNQSGPDEARSSSPGSQFRTTRFHYHAGARMYPRDSNNPEPRLEPVDDITNVVTGLMYALGAPPPGHAHAHDHAAGGFEARFGNGGANDQDHDNLHPGHPFFQLFSSLGLNGPTGQMGDFVYSQEGLDRIISQLMEQTASSNAPGPATQDDIDNLPRKKVDEEMLGAEHKAECSICMDEVNIGEEVTVLPCKHWFHHACIGAWLLEHDTCPHCRQGITKRNGGGNNAQNASSAQSTSDFQPSGSRSMPGAFDVSGSGTSGDPFVVSGDAGGESTTANNASSSGNTDSRDSGIAEHVRRGWFGPTQ